MASDDQIAELVILSKNIIQAKLALDKTSSTMESAYEQYAKCAIALISFDRGLEDRIDTDTEEAAYAQAAEELGMSYAEDKLFAAFRDEFQQRRMAALAGTAKLN